LTAFCRILNDATNAELGEKREPWLKPAAGKDFGIDLAAAVQWAGQTYDIRPDQLRPQPLVGDGRQPIALASE